MLRKRKIIGGVLYEDVYDNQAIYMLYHALRDLVHVAPTPPSPTLISAEAVDDMDQADYLLEQAAAKKKERSSRSSSHVDIY